MTAPDAYPLSWPVHVPRARVPSPSPFGKHSIGEARDVLLRELKLLGARQSVISSNLRLRQDGLPVSAQSQPRDAGVAVYFRLKEANICLPCDRWEKVEHNLWAIARDIEAQRGRQRWGVGSVEQAFAGYAALPAPTGAPTRDCWTVLGIPRESSIDEIGKAYRRLSRERHPDRPGGNHEAMVELNQAQDAAFKIMWAKANPGRTN